MALESQSVEILFEGLEQKTDLKVVKAGKFTRAINVEFDKTGSINKRRGYLRYDFAAEASLGESMEFQACNVGTYQGALLIFGINHLWVVASRDSRISGNAIVKKSRLLKGHLKTTFVATASDTTSTWS